MSDQSTSRSMRLPLTYDEAWHLRAIGAETAGGDPLDVLLGLDLMLVAHERCRALVDRNPASFHAFARWLRSVASHSGERGAHMLERLEALQAVEVSP